MRPIPTYVNAGALIRIDVHTLTKDIYRGVWCSFVPGDMMLVIDATDSGGDFNHKLCVLLRHKVITFLACTSWLEHRVAPA